MTRFNFNYHHTSAHNQPFIISELVSCLQNSPLSAQGHGGITYTMLKQLFPLPLNRLLDFFIRIWMKQILTRASCKAMVISFLEIILALSIITDRLHFANFLKKRVNCHLVHVLELNNYLAVF